MRILLAEDDQSLGSGLVLGLQKIGYTVDWVRDGALAWQAANSEEHDVMVLDVGLPRSDGFSVLEQMRANGIATPVLILTARDAVEDRIKGLDLGADDYLVKPFDLNELSARLRAIHRRRAGRASPSIKLGDLHLDPAAHTLTRAGQHIVLSSYEFVLIELLMTRAGRIVSRTSMQEALYGWDDGAESNALEVHVHHLRRKLGDPGLIRTVRGVGYQLAIESTV